MSSDWDNIHGVFAHCAGAETSDGSKFTNVTTAGEEHIDERFYLCGDVKTYVDVLLAGGCGVRELRAVRCLCYCAVSEDAVDVVPN